METLNSVRASHLSFTRSTINRLSQDCAPFVSIINV